jgi:hypothetical protein
MNWVWEHSPVQAGSLLVLLAIADYADDRGESYPSIESLARKARMSERNVHYVLDKLVKDEHLALRVGAGPRGTNLYRVVMRTPAAQGEGLSIEEKTAVLRGENLAPHPEKIAPVEGENIAPPGGEKVAPESYVVISTTTSNTSSESSVSTPPRARAHGKPRTEASESSTSDTGVKERNAAYRFIAEVQRLTDNAHTPMMLPQYGRVLKTCNKEPELIAQAYVAALTHRWKLYGALNVQGVVSHLAEYETWVAEGAKVQTNGYTNGHHKNGSAVRDYPRMVASARPAAPGDTEVLPF